MTERASLVYLTLPFFIFVFGWVRPAFALPIGALALASLVLSSRKSVAGDDAKAALAEPAAPGQREALVFGGLLALVVFLVAFSGAGGYSFQYADYLRHNAILRDLVEQSWPLAYSRTGLRDEPGFLALYLANSLPPGLVGRLWGWAAANHFSFLWTVAGVFLAVCAFLRVIDARSFRWGAFFLFFGGLDIVGRTIVLGWYWDGTAPLANWMVEYSLSSSPEVRQVMGRVFWFYPSNLNMVYYAPQHVLGSWLCISLILHDALRRGTCERAVFAWSATLLWSAFAFVGMLPFVLVAVVKTRGRGCTPRNSGPRPGS